MKKNSTAVPLTTQSSSKKPTYKYYVDNFTKKKMSDSFNQEVGNGLVSHEVLGNSGYFGGGRTSIKSESKFEPISEIKKARMRISQSTDKKKGLNSMRSVRDFKIEKADKIVEEPVQVEVKKPVEKKPFLKRGHGK